VIDGHRIFALALCVACLGCARDSPGEAPAEGPRVLFIGNSLTFANDLPGTFAFLTAGDRAYSVESVTKPGVALIDYFFDEGAALARIDAGGWDAVVMQQGPTWPGLCGDTLALAAVQFAARIHAKGAVAALLMTWPATEDLPYFDGVHVAYANAAALAGARFIPGGDAWRIAWSENPSLALYSSDGFHPSPLGTYLTALTVYEVVTGRDARQLPPSAAVGGVTLSEPESVIRLLQRAAHSASQAAAALRSGAAHRAPVSAGATC
jgi:hypothetical protein